MLLSQACRLLISVSLVCFGATAQTLATVSDRVIAALPAQERGWELVKDKLVLRDNAYEKTLVQIWTNGAETMTIDYDERRSEAEATKWLNTRPHYVSVGGGKPVPDVGDGALMWKGAGTRATLYARKGKATLMLSAPSPELAIRTAQLVVAQIHP